MSAYRDNLIARRDKVAAKLAELDERNLDLPNATGPGLVDYESHKRGLYEELDRLEVAIAGADGGFEIYTEVDT